MPNENNLLQERAQLAAVLDNPDAIQRIKEPTEKAGTCPAVHQPNGESTACRRNRLS